MTVEKIKSLKKCKDCGKPAYSYRVGWENPETKVTNWYPAKHYNQCEDCRNKMYKRITRKRKKNYEVTK